MDRLLGRGAPVLLEPWILLAIIAAAVVLSVPRITWRWFGMFTTLVHELGHAFSAGVLGRRVRAIRVGANHGGSTLSSGGAFSAVVSGFFGYPAPAIVGAALILSTTAGYTRAALVGGAVLVILSLIFLRGWGAILIALASVAGSAALWLYADAVLQTYALITVGLALLVGSIRGLGNVFAAHGRKHRNLASSDAYILARQTHIPSPVWLLGFTAAIAACVWASTLALMGAVSAG
ncbi:M50 family peptidase [Mycetocola tolaasinivorans]|uniref:M50 family peptidase n=1 Tax=Mycetocola tolaasinivorans TaxID=76635 RepID=A0A3L6ZYI6_9MICO|nr:M50 family peptidase [Mycetocola tolaasinivorans]